MVRVPYFAMLPFFVSTLSLRVQVASLNTVPSSLYALQNFSTYNVNLKPAGLYKNAGMFSYLRVLGAGQKVPAYLWQDMPRGAAALEMLTQLTQIMSDKPLSST